MTGKKRTGKKLGFALLTVLLVLGLGLPTFASAATVEGGTATCHSEHDESCGYRAAVAETPCNLGCETRNEAGELQHTEGCAYAPAVPGAACLHSCALCAGLCTLTEGCTLAAGHEGDCVSAGPCTLTEGCALAAGHEGDCVPFTPCTLAEGCALAAGHEGDCVPAGALLSRAGFSVEEELALAAMSLTASDFAVTGGTEGTDYSFDGTAAILTVHTGTPLTISNKNPAVATTHCIKVASGITANITLSGVNIFIASPTLKCAFDMRGATVNMTLVGNNKLISGPTFAGVFVPLGATLVIGGSGTLEASTTGVGAGIGGGFGELGTAYLKDAGNITINSGTIKATGGQYGAGIGGAYDFGSGGVVVVNGGTVVAAISELGGGAACIGGGKLGPGGSFTINGGVVTAVGDGLGAGIGGGGFATDTEAGAGAAVTINGGTVYAASGIGGASIGGGTGNSGWASNPGSFTTSPTGNGVVVTTQGVIQDQSQKAAWHGIIIEGAVGQSYCNAGQTLTPTDSFTVPAGSTLTLLANTSLQLKTGVSLTNKGNIVNNGATVNYGGVANTGSISINPLVNFSSQPPASTDQPIGDAVSITATASNLTSGSAAAMQYQWYENTSNSNTGGSLISGATIASYSLPQDKPLGTYYYYCEAKAGIDEANRGRAFSHVAVVHVVPQPAVLGVSISPRSAEVARSDRFRFTATVEKEGTASTDLLWSVSGNTSANTSIVADGADGAILTVSIHEAATALTVTATSVFDNDISDSVPVTLTAAHQPIVPFDPSQPLDLDRDMVVTFQGKYANMIRVALDDHTLTQTVVNPTMVNLTGYPGGYEPVLGKAEEGSVVVTLYKEFLRTLPEGHHVLVVEFRDEGMLSGGNLDFILPQQSASSSSSSTSSSSSSSTSSSFSSSSTSSAPPASSTSNTVQPGGSGQGGTGGGVRSPRTGDLGLGVWPWLAIALACAATSCGVLLSVSIKRYRANKGKK